MKKRVFFCIWSLPEEWNCRRRLYNPVSESVCPVFLDSLLINFILYYLIACPQYSLSVLNILTGQHLWFLNFLFDWSHTGTFFKRICLGFSLNEIDTPFAKKQFIKFIYMPAIVYMFTMKVYRFTLMVSIWTWLYRIVNKHISCLLLYWKIYES